MPSNLRIDRDRLWSTLMETAAIGGTAKGGINRQTLTDHDRVVRAWFKRETEALGCTVTVDEVGNMFALRPGRHADLAPIALGSHLDTQPTGGKFDGNLGVLGALEALRTLVAAGYETNAGIVVVNWTNEEGARFAPAMLGSGVFAGVYSRADADAIADIEGVRFFVEPGFARSNYWLNALLLDRPDPALRDAILTATNDAGLMTRPAWTLMHHLPVYRDCPRADVSVAEDVERRLINIPSSPTL